MGLLNDLALKQKAVLDESSSLEDRVGGNAITTTGIYDCKVTQCFVNVSDRGTLSLNLIFTDKETKKELKKTLYLTSSLEKGQSFTYIDKRTGKAVQFQGLVLANKMSHILTGKMITELTSSKAMVQVYDSNLGKTISVEKDSYPQIINQSIKVGVIKTTRFKQEKSDSGEYVDTTETMTMGELDNFFHSTSELTASEIVETAKSGLEKPEDEKFINKKWRVAYTTDYVKDFTNGKGTSKNASNGNPPAAKANVGKFERI